MATIYTDLTRASEDAKDRNEDGDKPFGDLRIARASYTLVDTESVADIIDIVKLPEGSTVIPHLSYVVLENPGTSLTLDIGDDDATTAVDPDRYADALDVAAGGAISFGVTGVAADAPYTLQAQSTIQATVMVESTLTAGALVVFYVAYVTNS
tara:strand:+ start:10896 stop:11354 length:459 start_codon:yes stop_codon:yes gene_type:complete